MSVTFAAILVFIILLLLIFMGCPVFASLGISATIGILLLRGWVGVSQIPSTMYGQLSSFVLIAVPMYLLMGEFFLRACAFLLLLMLVTVLYDVLMREAGTGLILPTVVWNH